MIKRNWKKIGMIILIFACIFNIMGKLINKLSLNKEMLYSAKNFKKYVMIKNSQIILITRKR